MTTLGIVIPCFNEEDVLPETCRRVLALRSRLIASGKITEASRLYFVDDGSTDKTWRLIDDFTRHCSFIVGIKLSRNRGHQSALLAGLLTAEGNALVSVDADLQDDIDVIEEMVDRFHNGSDVVYGVRKNRDSDSWFKRISAQSFYRIIEWMGAETVDNHADFRLLSRRAIDALRDYREVNLFIRGIIPLIGYPSTIVQYDRSERFAGESKYPLKKMLALAFEAITSFSVFPLRLISFLGFFVFAGAMAVTGWALWIALYSGRAIPGWASVVLPMYFLGGIELLALGVIGEYLGKLYLEAKCRPRFFIAQIVGGSVAGQASRGERNAERPSELADSSLQSQSTAD